MDCLSFYGYPFIFDNIPSETYGLYISNLGNKGGSSYSSGGSDVDIIKQKLTRKSNYFIQGVEQSTPLEFDLTILSQNELTRDMINIIQKWLFGQMKYKKLQVIQNDLLNIHFNCFLKSPEIITIGNVPYGISCKVECDAPWGWGNDMDYTVSNIVGEKTIEYHNPSDDNGYTYPIITFKTTSVGDVILKNVTDNENTIEFTGLMANDIITIDVNLQIIKSTQNDNVLSKSNFKWLKLVSGYNELIITGNLDYFNIKHKVARKVGS